MTVSPSHATSAGASRAVRSLQWGQHGLFTLLLVVAMAQSLLGPARVAGWVVAVGLLLCAWYGAGIVAARRRPTPAVGQLWLAGLVALWLPLAVATTSFRWLVFALLLLALHLLPRVPALVLVALLTAVVVWLGLRDDPGDPAQVIGPVLGAAIAVGVSAGYGAVLAESEARRRLVEDLRLAHVEQERLADELARTQRESGALAERARLARDIHDTLAQGFSSILLLARAEGERAPSPALARIEATAQENLTEARRVVHALAPSQLEEAPLPAALERLAAGLQAEAGIATRVDVSGDPRPVPTHVEVALLRVAQSALANVRLHSRAARCVVSLDYGDDGVSLDVVDDGVGFDTAHVPPSAGGFGLRAMRERVAELGGTLEIESSPADGTAVAAHLPLKELR